MPDIPLDANVFALYQRPDFQQATPEERTDFLGQYFDQQYAPGVTKLGGNVDTARQQFITAHTLRPDADPQISALYAERPDFAAAKPTEKVDFLGRLFDKDSQQYAPYVDKDTLDKAKQSFIAQNLSDADRHSYYGAGRFALDTLKDLGTDIASLAGHGLRMALNAAGAWGIDPQAYQEAAPVVGVGTPSDPSLVDRLDAAKAANDKLAELRYGDNPIVGHGGAVDLLGMKQSLGFGGVSGIPAVAGGLAGGPVGSAIAEGATAPASYFITGDQFLSQVLAHANQAMRDSQGRDLTQSESEQIYKSAMDQAGRYGAAQAIPEAISHTVLGGVVGKLAGGLTGKTLAGKAAQVAGGLALSDAVAQGAQTATGYAQGQIEQDAGLTDSAPTVGQAFKNQFATTNAMSIFGAGMSAAGGAAVNAVGRRLGLIPKVDARTDIERGGGVDLTRATEDDPFARGAEPSELPAATERPALPPGQQALPAGTVPSGPAIPMGDGSTRGMVMETAFDQHMLPAEQRVQMLASGRHPEALPPGTAIPMGADQSQLGPIPAQQRGPQDQLPAGLDMRALPPGAGAIPMQGQDGGPAIATAPPEGGGIAPSGPVIPQGGVQERLALPAQPGPSAGETGFSPKSQLPVTPRGDAQQAGPAQDQQQALPAPTAKQAKAQRATLRAQQAKDIAAEDAQKAQAAVNEAQGANPITDPQAAEKRQDAQEAVRKAQESQSNAAVAAAEAVQAHQEVIQEAREAQGEAQGQAQEQEQDATPKVKPEPEPERPTGLPSESERVKPPVEPEPEREPAAQEPAKPIDKLNQVFADLYTDAVANGGDGERKVALPKAEAGEMYNAMRKEAAKNTRDYNIGAGGLFISKDMGDHTAFVTKRGEAFIMPKEGESFDALKKAYDDRQAQHERLAARAQDGEGVAQAADANRSPRPDRTPGPRFLTAGDEEVSGLHVSEAKAAVDDVAKGMHNAPDFNVVQSQDEVPAHLQPEDGGKIKGVYDRETKAAWIVAENHADAADVAKTAAHEALGHHGLREALGDTYARTMDEAWKNDDVRKAALDIAAGEGKSEDDLLKNAAERQSLTDEALVRMGDEGVKNRWYDRIVSGVRGWLRGIGLDVQFSDSEVRDLIRSASDAARDGDKTGALHVLSEPDKDAPGDALVLSPSGRTDFGQVPDEIAQSLGRDSGGPIVLTNEDAQHILGRHSIDMERFGYSDPRQFVSDVASDFDTAHQGTGRSIIVSKDMGGRKGVVALKLEYGENGDTYQVKTAYPARADFQKGKPSLWERAQSNHRQQETGAPSAISGRSDSLNETISTPQGEGKAQPQETARPDQSGEAPQGGGGGPRYRRASPEPQAEEEQASGEDVLKGMNRGIPRMDDEHDKATFQETAKQFVRDLRDDAQKDRMGRIAQAFDTGFRLAKRFPETVGRVWETNSRHDDARHESLRRALDPTVQAIKGLNAEETAGLHDVVTQLDGKRLREVTENKFTKTDDGGYALNEAHYDQVRDVLTRHGVSENVADAYTTVRKGLDQALIDTWAKMKEMGVDKNAIDRFRQTMGNIQNYFPHMRFGDYWVNVTDPAGKVVWNEGVESRAEMARRKVELQKQYPDATITGGARTGLPESVFEKAMDTSAMMQVMNKAMDRAGTDPTLRDAIRQELAEKIGATIMQRGWAQHMLERENIPGYETGEVGKVLAAYHAGHQGWLAKIGKAQDFASDIAGMSATADPRAYAWSKNFTKEMLRNQEGIDRFVSTVRGITSGYFVGARVSTALHSLNHSFTNCIPRLSEEMGLPAGAMRYVKGALDTVGYMLRGRDAKGFSADEQELLQRFHDKGVTEAQFQRDVMGLQNGTMSNGLRSVLDASSAMLRATEVLRRTTTALAAYRAAREGKITNETTMERYGLKPGDKMDHVDAMDFARTVTDEANFVHGKANQPEVMRSGTDIQRGITGVAGALRMYEMNQFAAWRMMWDRGAEGKRALAYSMIAQGVLGGAKALVGYETLMLAAHALTGDDKERELQRGLRHLIGNKGADFAMYGAGAPFGITLSPSLTFDLPHVKDTRADEKVSDQLKDHIWDMLGPAASMVQNADNALGFWGHDDYYRAAESMAPAAISNVMRAYRMSTEGMTSQKGQPLGVPGTRQQYRYDLGEAVAQAAGFTPLSKAKMSDAVSSQKALDLDKQGMKEKLVSQYVQARKAGDQEKIAGLNAQRNAFNARMRENGDTGEIIPPLGKAAAQLSHMAKGSKASRTEGRIIGQDYGLGAD